MLMLLLAQAVLLLHRLAERKQSCRSAKTASPTDYEYAEKPSAYSKS